MRVEKVTGAELDAQREPVQTVRQRHCRHTQHCAVDLRHCTQINYRRQLSSRLIYRLTLPHLDAMPQTRRHINTTSVQRLALVTDCHRHYGNERPFQTGDQVVNQDCSAIIFICVKSH